MSNTLREKNRFSFMTVVCVIAFFLSNISYLPRFTASGSTQLLSYPAWAMVFGAILLYKQFYLSSRDVKFLVVLLMALSLMATLQGVANKYYFSSLLTKCFLLVMIITLAGGLVARTRQTWGAENVLLYSYVGATMLLCFVIFTNYLAGQDVTSRFYSYTSKNEASFLAVSAIIIMLAMPDAEKRKNFWFLVRSFMIVFLAYVTIYMRCRSMILALAVIILLFLIVKQTTKRMKWLLIAGSIVVFLALLNEAFYDEFVRNILFAGREKGDINDISSGRMDQINRGWELFKANILLGTGDTATIDCFYVSALMQYGLFMGGALIVLGIYPFFWGVVNYRRTRNPICLIMTVCAFVYLIGGFFEENAPFGPGVRCYISWFLFGYLRVQQTHGYFGGKNNEDN